MTALPPAPPSVPGTKAEALHLLRLGLDLPALLDWCRRDAGIGSAGDDLGYPVHAALTAAFGSGAPKPFRILDRRPGRRLDVLGYGPWSAERLAKVPPPTRG